MIKRKLTQGKIALSLIEDFEQMTNVYDDFSEIYPTTKIGIEKLKQEHYEIEKEIEKSYGELILVSERFVSKTIQLIYFLDIPIKSIYSKTQLPYRIINEWYNQLFKYDYNKIYVIDNTVYYLWHNDIFEKIYDFNMMVIDELKEFIEPFKNNILYIKEESDLENKNV